MHAYARINIKGKGAHIWGATNRDLCLVEIGFPKAMEVAIRINLKHHFVFQDGEDGFGFIARLKEAEGSAFIGEKIDPLDIVVLDHRMDDVADLDLDFAIAFGHDGNMFLHCRIHAAGNKVLHGFAAARGGAADGVEFHDHRTAFRAFIEFRHKYVSFVWCL